MLRGRHVQVLATPRLHIDPKLGKFRSQADPHFASRSFVLTGGYVTRHQCDITGLRRSQSFLIKSFAAFTEKFRTSF